MTASSGADKVVSQAGQTLAPLSCGFVSCRDDAQEIQNIWLVFQSSISELSGSGIQFFMACLQVVTAALSSSCARQRRLLQRSVNPSILANVYLSKIPGMVGITAVRKGSRNCCIKWWTHARC